MKFLKNKKVKFLYGFPVSDETDDTKNESKKGVAFLIAVMMTAMMMIFMSDLMLNSALGVRMAVSQRDNLKAEYMAKSGFNLALMLITGDFYKDLYVYETMGGQGSQMAQAMGGMLSWSDSPDDIWAQLNGLPISGESVEMITQFQENFDLSKVGDSKILDGIQLFDGSFDIDVVDQSSKINVNFCGVGQGAECMSMIRALMSCPAETDYLEKKKIEADQVVINIKDYIDENSRVTEGSNNSSENGPYEDRVPDQGPKNAFLDSLEELKQVDSWDDDLHIIFSPYLRVFPQPVAGDPYAAQGAAINFNTVDRAFMDCLLASTNTQCSEKVALSFNQRQDPESGYQPPSNYKDLKQRLASDFCSSDEKTAKMFTYRTDIFKVVANGNVGEQSRKLNVDVERIMPNDEMVKANILDSYKIWNWKVN